MGGDLTEIDKDNLHWWLTGHGWRQIVDSLSLGFSYAKNGCHLYRTLANTVCVDNGKWSFEPGFSQAEIPVWAMLEGDNPVLDVLARDSFTPDEVFAAVERQRIILMIDRMEKECSR